MQSLKSGRAGLGYIACCSFSPLFSLPLIGLTRQATSDFQLMKAVAGETRLSPMGRQQRLARLADDIQRYWARVYPASGLVYGIGWSTECLVP